MQQNGRGPEGQELSTSEINEITNDFMPRERELLGMNNVVGVGAGTKFVMGENTGERAVKVLVSQKLPKELLSLDDLIPESIGGTKTDVEEVGVLLAGGGPGVQSGGIQAVTSPADVRKFTAPFDGKANFGEPNGHSMGPVEQRDVRTAVEQQAAIEVLTRQTRPVEGGYSIGHYAITAGTYATAVYDRDPYPGIPRRYYALSNNHVLANSNLASIGDPVLQPGPYDGGVFPSDMVAVLSRYVPIQYGGPENYVDAAIAEGPFHVLDREIYWIGYVKGVRGNWPSIGEVLQKTGRTTNYTTGRVIAINATVDVGGYPVAPGWARFRSQIVTGAMSAGGDSGSLVLDMNENAIGLLFAGSSTSTIINHIYYVQALLAIRIV